MLVRFACRERWARCASRLPQTSGVQQRREWLRDMSTKKSLGIPTCAEGFLAPDVTGDAHVKPVSRIVHGSGVGVSVVDVAPLTIDTTTRTAGFARITTVTVMASGSTPRDQEDLFGGQGASRTYGRLRGMDSVGFVNLKALSFSTYTIGG